VLLLACERGFAGELWSWHTFDVTAVKTSGAEVILHGRLRTGRSFGTLQQGRAGAVAKFRLNKTGTLIGGYYYGKEEDSAEDWRNSHRVFGGMEVPIYRGRGVVVETRGLVERFFAEERPQYSRYRHRVRVQTTRRIGPYVSSEWFFDADGYLSGRYSGGLRWRSVGSRVVEIGYLYDARRAGIGEPRHVIVTQLTFDFSRR